jgi:hypothetical protein
MKDDTYSLRRQVEKWFGSSQADVSRVPRTIAARSGYKCVRVSQPSRTFEIIFFRHESWRVYPPGIARPTLDALGRAARPARASYWPPIAHTSRGCSSIPTPTGRSLSGAPRIGPQRSEAPLASRLAPAHIAHRSNEVIPAELFVKRALGDAQLSSRLR